MEEEQQLTEEEISEILSHIKIKKTWSGLWYTWKLRWWYKHNRDKYNFYLDNLTEIIYNELDKLAKAHGGSYVDELPENEDTGRKLSARDIAEMVCQAVVDKELGMDEACFWLDIIIYKGENLYY